MKLKIKVWKEVKGNPLGYAMIPQMLDLTVLEDFEKFERCIMEGKKFIVTHVNGVRKNKEGNIDIDTIIMEEIGSK